MTASSPEPIAYLFYGQDEPLLKERLASFLRKFSEPSTADLNTSRFDGRAIQIGDIEQAASALPFMADLRLVLVENLTETASGREIIERLPDLLPRLPGWARIALIEKGFDGDPLPAKPSFEDSAQLRARRPALKKLVQTLEADPRGRVLAFNMPRSLVQWIAKRAEHYQVQIDQQAAQELASRTAGDLLLADVELEKLATYTNRARAITKEDVDRLTPYVPEAGIFNMVDALGQQRGAEALWLLRRLLEEGEEPLAIFGMIIRQYRLLLLMKEQLGKGVTAAAASKALSVQEFVAVKIATQAGRYSLETLERIYRYLLTLDLEMKTGETDPDLALEMLVATLSGGR
jgi:DNA polymerase-3 subunit delta